MKKFFAFLLNPVVISIVGLITISLLIWFAGPHIKFGSNNVAPLAGVTARLIGIMVALTLWGLNNLWIQARNKKSNSNLVTGLKPAQADESLGSNDQTAEEMHQISERFQQALETLKRYKFKGATGSKALYELPWYIIVGPPGSGKTTALVNSGLEFPLADSLGKGALQGVGGTRNCDWWFTNDAVLIDTAGRYTTQDSHKVVDSSAWEGFLDLLRKNRRRRPINGAIVAISLQDLLMQTEDERLLHAKTIRTRLDELMEKLQIRFPVYLMFTKADLISGFSEFFEDFSKDEREQVWGVSLPDAANADSIPDFDYLKTELTELTHHLYARVMWRLNQERDVKRRGAIQGFPQQFENMRTIAESFVQQTFAPNRFKFQPYLRGVYFSSGTQDGTPIDRLMASVAANFGFTRDVAAAPQQQGKSFFLSRLFQEVIFPESELVGSNVGYERTLRWLTRGAYAAMAATIIGLGIIWSGAVVKHKLFMNDVNAHVGTYTEESAKIGKRNNDLRLALPPLNALTQASAVYDKHEHSWLSSLGMYDQRVDSTADKAYNHQLKALFLPKLLAILEKEIARGHDGGDLYDTFRVYMMFQKTNKLDTERVSEWFKTYWDETLRGEGTRRKELEYHLEKLLALKFAPAELNANFVRDTRALLLREPVAHRVYSRVRTNPLYTRRVDLLAQFGDTVRSVFKLSSATQRALQIPFMFTKEGYNNIDLSKGSPLVADIVNERWVLTDNEEDKLDFISEDLEDIANQVKDLYLSEYIRVWSSVYKQFEVVEFRSMQHAEEVLATVMDPVYSPIMAILEVGLMNTQLRPPKDDIEAAAAKNPKKGGMKTRLATKFLLSQYEGTKVDKHFRDINALVSQNARGHAPISDVMSKVQQLHLFVADIAIAPDPAEQAFLVAKQRFQNGAGNPMTGLQTYSQSLPDPVRPWLEKLSKQSWRMLLGSAHGYADSEWRVLVYRPYSESLKGRYPLKRSALDEMALYDFAEFFKPGGTMDKYYDEVMAPFVNTRNGWRNRAVDNVSLGFSNESLRQMQRAQSIKDIFYRESPDTISVTMELKPRAMDERDARFTLDVGDARLSYKHGPKFWKRVNWKANQENMQVRMAFEDLNGTEYDRSFHGPWAWFRLLDASYVEKTSQSTTYWVTFSAGDERGTSRDAHKIAYEVKTKSVDNPLRRDLLSSFNVPESI